MKKCLIGFSIIYGSKNSSSDKTFMSQNDMIRSESVILPIENKDLSNFAKDYINEEDIEETIEETEWSIEKISGIYIKKTVEENIKEIIEEISICIDKFPELLKQISNISKNADYNKPHILVEMKKKLRKAILNSEDVRKSLKDLFIFIKLSQQKKIPIAANNLLEQLHETKYICQNLVSEAKKLIG